MDLTAERPSDNVSIGSNDREGSARVLETAARAAGITLIEDWPYDDSGPVRTPILFAGWLPA